MADYWLHYLRGRRLIGWDDFCEDSDEAAVVRASEMRGGHAAELWQGHRKVWTFEPHPRWRSATEAGDSTSADEREE